MPAILFSGHSLETILLAGSILLIISVLASRISSRFGVPLLLIFLVIGMLAGSEGPGQIDFENYSLSFAIGSICLAFIVFDGGLRTSWSRTRPILAVGTSLSFFGTLITGLATGIFAHYALGMSWIAGLLLGAIVSSTDAAAVFGILRAKHLKLKGNLKQTLEFEAGSNDPVAVFFTITVLSFFTSPDNGFFSVIEFFLIQAGLGLAMGYGGGKIIRWMINHVGIDYEGLYSVLLIGLVVFLFALTSYLGGSGFLAAYVAGLFLGNSDLLYKGTISRFLDGMAWIAQIIVFLTLGLLAFPTHLMSVWKEGLLLGFFMMFIARPLSVYIAAPGKIFASNEKLFVSWIGLRGAAPIILATLPWSVNFPNAEYIFNLVFFVVLISVISQGISIPFMARLFNVAAPIEEEAHKFTAEVLPSGFSLIELTLHEGAPAHENRVVDLQLPSGVILTSIERGGRYLIPKGNTVLHAGDKISALIRPSNVEGLKMIFGDEEINQG